MSDKTGRTRRRRRLAWPAVALGAIWLALIATAEVHEVATATHQAAPSARSTAAVPGGTTASSTSSASAAGTAPAVGSTPLEPAGVQPAAARPGGTPGTADVAALAGDGIPVTARNAYVRAAATAPCRIGWPLLAAIGRVESDHGRFAGAVLHTDGLSTPPIIGLALDGQGTALVPDTDGGRLDGDPVYDRAVGPMQFIPSTWVAYAADGDGDGRRDPFDINDAAAAAARYLCAAGGDLSTVAGQRHAVYAYNQSDSYVATVLVLAAQYAGTPPPTLPTEPPPPAPVPPANPAPPPAVHVLVRPPAAPASSPTATAPRTAISSSRSTTGSSSSASSSSSATSSSAGSSSSAASSSSSRPATTAPSTTAPSTTPPSTTSPSTTSPSTTPPPTTSPSTTSPATSSSSAATTSTPPTSTPATSSVKPSISPSATPSTSSPSTSSAAPACRVPALGNLGTVDIRNGSGDPAVATTVAARLTRAGITVGAVTTAPAATSVVDYPAGRSAAAAALARALGVSARPAGVPRVTLVIGARDSGGLGCTG